MAWRPLLSFWFLLSSTAWAECHGEVCESRQRVPLAGRGVSLLQAMSRNKSSAQNATAKAENTSSLPEPDADSEGTAEVAASDLGLGDDSGVEEAIKLADDVGSIVENTVKDSAGNITGYASPLENLSSQESGVNYSVMSDKEVPIPEPTRPYVAAEASDTNANSSKNGSSSVVEIHPIKGASPMPEPVAGNLTAAMHDCILGEWGEWSECLTDDANGYASPHQVRERSVVQPYLPGGQPCELTVESRTCQLISAANTLVNLGGE